MFTDVGLSFFIHEAPKWVIDGTLINYGEAEMGNINVDIWKAFHFLLIREL